MTQDAKKQAALHSPQALALYEAAKIMRRAAVQLDIAGLHADAGTLRSIALKVTRARRKAMGSPSSTPP